MRHSASPSSADAVPASPGARGATRARRERIVAMVQSGETAVESLSAVLAVSPSTIRRDLAELRRDGRITRTYGGALLTGHGHETTVDERDGQAWEQKHAIAGAPSNSSPTATPSSSTAAPRSVSSCPG